ncbi:MAG: hypothetical protein ABSC11_02140 [Smithella sp.]
MAEIKMTDRLKSYHNGVHGDFFMSVAQRIETLEIALSESLKLQSHYAELLNMHDGGKRIGFKTIEEWINRLEKVREITREHIKRNYELNGYQMEMLFIERLCPDCGFSGFLGGPEGGCSQNIKCGNCGNKFNICPPFFAERI